MYCKPPIRVFALLSFPRFGIFLTWKGRKCAHESDVIKFRLSGTIYCGILALSILMAKEYEAYGPEVNLEEQSCQLILSQSVRTRLL